MKKTNSKIRPVEGFIEHLWRWSPLVALLVAVGLICGSCGAVKPVPVETTTEVHYIDSVRYEIRDSIRIIERSRWKDYGGLLDTLGITGNRSSMKAWIDTTNNILNGTLEEEPQEEHYKVIYKDRWKVRDSLAYKEVPVEVPVIQKERYIPWIFKFLSGFGIFSILSIIIYILIKFKIIKI